MESGEFFILSRRARAVYESSSPCERLVVDGLLLLFIAAWLRAATEQEDLSVVDLDKARFRSMIAGPGNALELFEDEVRLKISLVFDERKCQLTLEEISRY